MPKTFYYIFNLFLVFLLEYIIITSFANVMDYKVKQANPKDKDVFAIKDYFVVVNICYQVGAFISRSSLEYVKIPRVWLFTFVQAINFVVIFLNADYYFAPSLFFMCPMFLWVGLMGGASYVNVVNCLLQLDRLEQSERESAISLSLIFNDIGVLLAAVCSVMFDNWYFQI